MSLSFYREEGKGIQAVANPNNYMYTLCIEPNKAYALMDDKRN